MSFFSFVAYVSYLTTMLQFNKNFYNYKTFYNDNNFKKSYEHPPDAPCRTKHSLWSLTSGGYHNEHEVGLGRMVGKVLWSRSEAVNLLGVVCFLVVYKVQLYVRDYFTLLTSYFSYSLEDIQIPDLNDKQELLA